MGKYLVFTGPRNAEIQSYDEPDLAPDKVRVRTLYTGISAGTELTLYRGTMPNMHKTFNRDKRLFEEGGDTNKYPIYGSCAYENVGEIVEIGKYVSKLKIGDIVYGNWGHKSTGILSEEYICERVLPKDLDTVCGIFAQIGSIALNAILDANIHIGETVAIFGQGVPGQIATKMAKLNGGTVIAVDLDDSRLEWSKKSGADYILNPQKCNVPSRIKDLTDNRGADVCIEISGSTIALNDAIKSCVYNGTVVASGFYQGDSKGLFLGEEFHHNRIDVKCSQISGVSLDISNKWNRVRMDKTIMDLQKRDKLNLKSLISHMFDFNESAEAFRMIDENTSDIMQVVFDYSNIK